jgi:hypothetical protein
MAISGRSGNVKATAATATTAAAEDFDLVAGTTASYQIVDTAMRHWDLNPNTAGRPRILVDGSTAGVPSYDVNYVQGIITFSSDPGSTAVTGDVEYVTASNIAAGRSWTLNVNADLFEATVFSSSGWREFTRNQQGGTVSVGAYHDGSTAPWFDNINLNLPVVLELYPDNSAGDRYECYAYMTGDSVDAAVDSLIGETLDFQVHGAIYYTTSA